MPLHEDYVATLPVGKLGVIALESCRQMGEKIDRFLVDWRNKRVHEAHTPTVLLDGYRRDSFLVHLTEIRRRLLGGKLPICQRVYMKIQFFHP